ncbi:hypothetical protein CE91St62_01530 [Lachnospiraceae bacterium]|uniref:LysM peptidoglycan-binding domain-containing protein n=1 Tax=Extibacter sp. GGCC_0201 TaxID=2731209 RepID=UPI001AA14B84|nr:LysM peptidoglycan-binding domain-containing protein [Extibacter sp. GGCC_0201]MBO1722697.1 LysM peptidoglycan-binding domain-containing protein [Extibacter sp. GGCC_0201]BDF32079.1 hypothetical protein CE91St61_01540 [Lachnospiraceae bacterium]BDF36092.1 hypothetical protein CE91St62_01530 [Lachnospiraceae bacterium]
MEKQFPKNVRQIGNVSDEPKIYVEDYVDTYLSQLREKAAETAIGAALVGEIQSLEEQDVVYISGAIQMKELEVKGTEIAIEEETWKQLEEDKQEYFPSKELVGWCLIETGHPMGLNSGVKKVHEASFSKANSIFIWKDALEADEIYYAYKYHELMQMGGHYIYYEKNPSMQNYMINTRKKIGVTPSEVVEDRAAKDFRSAVREKMEYKEQKGSSKFTYATSVLLVVVVLAIGISTVNNFDKMEAVQTSLESLSQSVNKPESKTGTVNENEGEDSDKNTTAGEAKAEDADAEDKEVSGGTVPETSTIQEQLGDEDYYVVQKGDTLDSISVKLYGNTSHVEAICKMNGLSDGNLIFIGQKLLLP